jgi:hypothetical protein
LTISSITMSNSTDFNLVESAPLQVPAGDSSRIHFEFHPMSAGSHSCKLTFTHNASSSPDTLHVEGTGVVSEAVVFSMTPMSLSFGEVEVPNSKTDSVLIKNAGTGTLIIGHVLTDESKGLSITESTPLTLTAGDSSWIHIHFQPVVSGTIQSPIVFVHNGSTSPDTLVAEGTGFEYPKCTLLLSTGWNMISIPFKETNPNVSFLFPDATSAAFAYSGQYQSRDTLANGPGYWLKFGKTDTVVFMGTVVSADTFNVRSGWNMIGTLSVPVPIDSISSLPANLLTSAFYKYNAGYSSVDTLQPGYGYWVKVYQAGQLIMSAGGNAIARSSASSIRVIPTGEFPPQPPNETASQLSKLPLEYVLEQAYPNPFNPVTTITYALLSDSYVQLTVFNTLGQEISNLIGEVQTAGYHNVTWNAGENVSGLYFYRLDATSISDPNKSFSKVMKMLLIK